MTHLHGGCQNASIFLEKSVFVDKLLSFPQFINNAWQVHCLPIDLSINARDFWAFSFNTEKWNWRQRPVPNYKLL